MTIGTVGYVSTPSVARDVHAIGVSDPAVLGWVYAHGRDLSAARAAASEEGRLDIAPVLELLDGGDHRVLGRGMRRLAFELGARYGLTPLLMRAADYAERLERERRPEARGAFAFEAGASLRSALLVIVGPVMTRAQVPDLLERIRLLGEAPAALDLTTTFEPEVE